MLDSISDFERMYPTLEAYLKRCDYYLELHCGLGHMDLEDYMWCSEFEDEVPPNEAVDEYFMNNPAWG